MDLRAYLTILWRRKWVIVVTTVIAVTVVVIGTLMMIPEYEASTTLRIATAVRGSVDRVDYDVQYAERLMNTHAGIATSRPVLDELVQRLDLDEPPNVEVHVPANSELMQITVYAQNPDVAAQAANALAEIVIAQSRDLYISARMAAQETLSQRLAQLEAELNQAWLERENLVSQSPDDSERIATATRLIALKERQYADLLAEYDQTVVRDSLHANTPVVFEPADTPLVPSKPNMKQNIALGVLMGLIGGIGLAFLFENLDTRLRTTEQITAAANLPAVGMIPVAGKQPEYTILNGDSPLGEAVRRLRTNIFAPNQEAPYKTLIITSAEPGEGKSTILASLAVALAQSGRQVIAVDSDLRRPTLHKMFHFSNHMGLSNVLKQKITLAKAVQHTTNPEVHVLTSGPSPSNPAELLSSPQMVALIEQLAQQFDIVLLDTPSLLAVADAAVLAPIVDGVLLVVGRVPARTETVQAARRQLEDVRAKSIGVVVNRVGQNANLYKYYSPIPKPKQRDVHNRGLPEQVL
jgi:non-specific protein-tyrosine kinase